MHVEVDGGRVKTIRLKKLVIVDFASLVLNVVDAVNEKHPSTPLRASTLDAMEMRCQDEDGNIVVISRGTKIDEVRRVG